MTNKGLGTTSWLGRSGTESIKWRRIQRGISRGISTIIWAKLSVEREVIYTICVNNTAVYVF